MLGGLSWRDRQQDIHKPWERNPYHSRGSVLLRTLQRVAPTTRIVITPNANSHPPLTLTLLSAITFTRIAVHREANVDVQKAWELVGGKLNLANRTMPLENMIDKVLGEFCDYVLLKI